MGKKAFDLFPLPHEAEGLVDPQELIDGERACGYNEFVAPDIDLKLLTLEQRVSKAKDKLAEAEKNHYLVGQKWKKEKKLFLEWTKPHYNHAKEMDEFINPHFDKVKDLEKQGLWLAQSILYWTCVLEQAQENLEDRDAQLVEEDEDYKEPFDEEYGQKWLSYCLKVKDTLDPVRAAKLLRRLQAVKKIGRIKGDIFAHCGFILAQRSNSRQDIVGLLKYLKKVNESQEFKKLQEDESEASKYEARDAIFSESVNMDVDDMIDLKASFENDQKALWYAIDKEIF